jgi:hypothetical protein
MKALAISIGIWGALKLSLLGVMKVILEMLRLNNKLGLASDDSLANAERNYAKFKKGTVDTFTTVENLLTKADQIKNFQFDKADLAKVEKEAKSWEDKLKKALSGDPKKKIPRAPKVAIGKVEIVMDLRDSDPDRLMAAFIEPLERMADKRVQAYDQLEQGI